MEVADVVGLLVEPDVGINAETQAAERADRVASGAGGNLIEKSELLDRSTTRCRGCQGAGWDIDRARSCRGAPGVWTKPSVGANGVIKIRLVCDCRTEGRAARGRGSKGRQTRH